MIVSKNILIAFFLVFVVLYVADVVEDLFRKRR